VDRIVFIGLLRLDINVTVVCSLQIIAKSTKTVQNSSHERTAKFRCSGETPHNCRGSHSFYCEGVKYFVEPAGGTLRRALSKRHHVIFGRRGSGTSSCSERQRLLDCSKGPLSPGLTSNPFKGHSYPDLVIRVLFTTIYGLPQNGWTLPRLRQRQRRPFGPDYSVTIPTNPAYHQKSCEELSNKLQSLMDELECQLHSTDAADLHITPGASSEMANQVGGSGQLDLHGMKIGADAKTRESANENPRDGGTIQTLKN